MSVLKKRQGCMSWWAQWVINNLCPSSPNKLYLSQFLHDWWLLGLSGSFCHKSDSRARRKGGRDEQKTKGGQCRERIEFENMIFFFFCWGERQNHCSVKVVTSWTDYYFLTLLNITTSQCICAVHFSIKSSPLHRENKYKNINADSHHLWTCPRKDTS